MTWLLHLYFGSVALLWLGALGRAVSARKKTRYKLTGEESGPEDPLRVAIVIPARNEVHNIEACVRTALSQDWPQVKVFVMDDGSTDGTGELLSRLEAEEPHRLRVLKGGDAPLPEGWLGKPWACERAGRAALSDDFAPQWLLFSDADVRFSPSAVRAALGYASREGLSMLSGWGTLTMASFWEKLMQPVVVGMILAGNDMEKVNDKTRRSGNPIANGQFILLRREAWEAVGGHGAVRGNVLDDVGMAIAIEKAGLPLQMVFMRPLFSCRMYDSLSSLWEGWTKNLFAGLNRSWPTLLALVLFTLVYTVMPYVVLLLGLLGIVEPVWLAWGGLCVLLIQALRLYLDGTFGSQRIYGLTHGPGSLLLVLLLLNSGLKALRGTATWKGRTLPSTAG